MHTEKTPKKKIYTQCDFFLKKQRRMGYGNRKIKNLLLYTI